MMASAGVYALAPPAYSLQLDPNAIYLVSAGELLDIGHILCSWQHSKDTHVKHAADPCTSANQSSSKMHDILAVESASASWLVCPP